MDVILLERVEKLGNIGEIVSVKPGFARNFLLPRNKALRASEANKKRFEANRANIEAENAMKRDHAIEDSKAVEGKSVILIRQASNTGQLYGSVATRDHAEALSEDGAKVSRSQIILDRPIKALGLYEVRVALHPEVSVTIKVNIARSPEEAELQAKGVDVTADMFERDNAGFTEAYDPNAEPGLATDEVAEAEVVEEDTAEG
jgi:large subunit ribosomal protein L9